jgi:hypothetical protein
MIEKLIALLKGIPDHILALLVVTMGVAVAFTRQPQELSLTLIAAGLTMYRGNQDK